MQFKLSKMNLMLALVVVVSLIAVLGCAEEEAEEPVAPAAAAPAAPAQAAPAAPAVAPAPAPAAPQAPQQPAAAAPAAQPAAPAAPAAAIGPTGAVPERTGPTAPAPTTAEYKYVAKKTPPGGFPSYVWDGPLPTNLKESPASAELVEQGKILPLEQRIPTGDDVMVVPPTQEIGIYGGEFRAITAASEVIRAFVMNRFILQDADLGGRVNFICKDWDISDDGTVYTFTIRKGMRWSDGYPLTMEDIRFSVEDLTFNEELVALPSYFRAPISGNPMEFKVVDDYTFTLTYDDPFFTLIESRDGPRWMLLSRCPLCFYSAAHYMKRFHIKYNEKEITEKLLEQYQQPTWEKLMALAGQTANPDIMWVPPGDPLGEQIPKESDPDYIYRGEKMYFPYTGGFLKSFQSDDQKLAIRNHYFIGVDPEGNQLPYLDGLAFFSVESRDVAVFRSMNGETDLYGSTMILSEMPLYLSNMEKGDYSVIRYSGTGGSDVFIQNSQEYTEDPEIGALTRSTDFRIALSLAWDRNMTNEIAWGGMGTPQNWVPHPDTPYYPGDQYATLDTEHDVDRARALMKKMGYEDRDGDGYVDRKDGKGPLELFLQTENLNHYRVLEVLQHQWKDIGIKLNIREGNARRGIAGQDGTITEYFQMDFSYYGNNPWFVNWTGLVPAAINNPIAPQMGKYVATRGEEGMAPTGPDPKYTDAYGNMAPVGTYPADITGKLKRLQEVYLDGHLYKELSPKRIEFGKEIFRINSEEKFSIGGLAFSGFQRGIRFRRNNFRNAPINHYSFGGETAMETYYFEDGIDNMNHPGNKSKKYKSISFMDAAYWD